MRELAQDLSIRLDQIDLLGAIAAVHRPRRQHETSSARRLVRHMHGPIDMSLPNFRE